MFSKTATTGLVCKGRGSLADLPQKAVSSAYMYVPYLECEAKRQRCRKGGDRVKVSQPVFTQMASLRKYQSNQA